MIMYRARQMMHMVKLDYAQGQTNDVQGNHLIMYKARKIIHKATT
jgi:hypothetical protein